MRNILILVVLLLMVACPLDDVRDEIQNVEYADCLTSCYAGFVPCMDTCDLVSLHCQEMVDACIEPREDLCYENTPENINDCLDQVYKECDLGCFDQEEDCEETCGHETAQCGVVCVKAVEDTLKSL